MEQQRYEDACRAIHAMNLLIRSFNDDGWMEKWLSEGVPDGTEKLVDIMATYPNDADFDQSFEDLQALFCYLIAAQCAHLQMPVRGTDFPPSITFHCKSVIWCGQKVK